MPWCPLVNPLNPTNLCTLKAGHPGSKYRMHLLATMAGGHTKDPCWADTVSRVMFMAPVGTTRKKLVELGKRAAGVDA